MGTFSLSTYNFLFLKAFAHFHLKQTARHAAEVVENQQDWWYSYSLYYTGLFYFYLSTVLITKDSHTYWYNTSVCVRMGGQRGGWREAVVGIMRGQKMKVLLKIFVWKRKSVLGNVKSEKFLFWFGSRVALLIVLMNSWELCVVSCVRLLSATRK